MAYFNPENYVDVQERINLFWSEYPDGAIVTRLMSPPDDFTQCRYEATVYKHKDDQRPSATGYAFELAGGGGANKTSHEENCETSAIGRALANMAYAKNRDDRPSRQEMQKVERGNGAQSPQNAPGRTQAPQHGQRPNIGNPDAPASDKQINFIRALAKERGMTIQGPDGSDHTDETAIAAVVGIDFQQDWPNITKGVASTLIENWQSERPARQGSFAGADPDRFTR